MNLKILLLIMALGMSGYQSLVYAGPAEIRRAAGGWNIIPCGVDFEENSTNGYVVHNESFINVSPHETRIWFSSFSKDPHKFRVDRILVNSEDHKLQNLSVQDHEWVPVVLKPNEEVNLSWIANGEGFSSTPTPEDFWTLEMGMDIPAPENEFKILSSNKMKFNK